MLARGHNTVRAIALPDGLLQAFAAKRCIPVVGPDIVPGSSTRRSEEVSLPLKSIVEKLANEIGYPERERLRLAESPAGMTEYVLQNVAQFFQAQQPRFKLIEAVREICSRAGPSQAHLQLADWDVTALFYLHFDGLMEEAYRSERHAPTVADSIEATADQSSEDQLLVLVRGTINVPGSLILTEEDHDRLAESIAHLPARLEEITTLELGRSIVFIGANPWDPTVRQLAKKLIVPGGTQGPPFFVVKSVSEVDRAWWMNLAVEWIEAEPAKVIAALSAQSS